MIGLIIRIFKLLLNLPFIIWGFVIDKKSISGSVHLYGIYGFFGLPGKGKTMAMCYLLDELRRKYKNRILITTNFSYVGEDFAFSDWKQLLEDYDRPLVVAWDEVQNEFNSRKFKDFPIELMTLLTQVRKKNGVQILYTSQKWGFVDKNFRELTFGCYQCNTLLGRYTTAKFYDTDDYNQLCLESNVSKKLKIRSKSWIAFYQSDSLRKSYDSYKMLDTAKNKAYMDREEVNNTRLF